MKRLECAGWTKALKQRKVGTAGCQRGISRPLGGAPVHVGGIRLFRLYMLGEMQKEERVQRGEGQDGAGSLHWQAGRKSGEMDRLATMGG